MSKKDLEMLKKLSETQKLEARIANSENTSQFNTSYVAPEKN